MVSDKEREGRSQKIPRRNISEESKYLPLYRTIDPWVRPILERFGKNEWGRWGTVIELRLPNSANIEEEHGWIIKKLAVNLHYLVGIGAFEIEGVINPGFFIKTGGDTVFSKELTSERLVEALQRASKFGPTHLPPPNESVSRR